MKSRPCQWYGEGRERSRGDGCGAFGVCVAGVRTRICCRHAVVQRSAGCRTGWLGLESAVMKGSACSLSSAVSYESCTRSSSAGAWLVGVRVAELLALSPRCFGRCLEISARASRCFPRRAHGPLPSERLSIWDRPRVLISDSCLSYDLEPFVTEVTFQHRAWALSWRM